jgi:FlaG/FlaF family flagellin (archaellin)
MKFNPVLATVALGATLGLAGTAHSATYVYDLVGSLTSGEATGSITTDTNSGVVALADIASWNITIDAGNGAVNLNTSNSSISGNYSNGITATASGLFFDFSGSPTQYIEFNDSSNNQVNYCSGPPGCVTGFEQVAIQANNAGGHFFYTGSQEIASIAPTGVPEPAVWVMMSLGFAGLGFAGYRKAKGNAGLAA